MPLILPFRRMMPSVGPSVTAGSAAFLTPGTYNFIVPYYNTMTVYVDGAGGGGGGWDVTSGSNYYGSAGTYSYFAAPDATLIGYGGQPGSGASYPSNFVGNPGAPGAASGGNVANTTGGGAAGGSLCLGGVSGQWSLNSGSGGYGGRAVRTWTRSQWYTVMQPKTSITIVIGSGGAPGYLDPDGPVIVYPTAGANGDVYIYWS